MDGQTWLPHELSLVSPDLYGRDAERAEFAVRLFDVDPFDGACLVGLGFEFLSDVSEETLHTFYCFRFRYTQSSRVPLLNFPNTRPSYAPPSFIRPSQFGRILLAS